MPIRSRVLVLLVLLTAVLVPLRTAVASAPGDVDTTFGNNGRIQLHLSTVTGGKDGATWVKPLPDGSFLMSGWADRATRDYVLVKFDANGAVDKSFGTNGKTYTNFFDGLDYPAQVAVDGSGRILMAGCAGPSGGENNCDDFGMARFTANGKPDTTFGTHGRVTTDFHGGADSGYSLVVMANGDYALGGWVRGPNSGPFSFGIAMYTPSGALDTSFGGDGKVSGRPSGTGVYALVSLPNGELIGAGSSGSDVYLAKYETDGTLDPTFGNNGVETKSFGNSLSVYTGIDASDGSVIVAGHYSVPGSIRMFVAKFKPNGSLDTTFGTNGSVKVGVGAGHHADGDVLVEQPDGKLVVAGEALVSGSNYNVAVVRFLPDGSLDPAFGTSGKTTYGFGPTEDYAYGVGIQTNGRIVAAGQDGDHTALVGFVGDSGPNCTLIGTTGADTLTGGGSPDVICGLGGSDTLTGGPGDDFLFGGPGDDTLNGGAGTDTCKQGAGTGTKTSCEH